jgi:hypothetical protein
VRTALAVLGILAVVSQAAPAMATTAGAVCTISDANLRLETSSAVGSSMGGPWHLSGLNGRMEVLARGAPLALRTVTLQHEELAHHWHYGRDLKLHIALVRPGAKAQAEAELMIETRSPNAGGSDYSGSYVLIVREEAASTFRGRVRCRVLAD